jgi:hypothetical protein
MILFFSFFPKKNYCQILDVTVVDSINRKIYPVILSISDVSDSLNIQEYHELTTGEKKIKLLKNYKSIVIKTRSYSYYTNTDYLNDLQKDSTYVLIIKLRLKPPEVLDDVLVKYKRKPFSIKKDTISYTVSSYSDGSERKIQEIIKRLPGIQVNELSGEIKYQGKSIETVTLDGDNLFGYNYTMGTKNINVDIVDRIEAIENYSENPLLNGIESGDNVSLNLILKENSLDFSGSIDASSGLYNDGNLALDINSNILGITKTYKSFATLSHNNIGNNKTPFDYFGFSPSVEQIKEEDYFSKKIIPETQFENTIDSKRANINEQYFGNYNAIFKLNPKLSVKTNLYYIQDKITVNQINQNQFEINGESFVTTDNALISKRPRQYRGDLEIKYKTTEFNQLDYNLRLRQENILTPTSIIQNQTQGFQSELRSEDFYLKQRLLWTSKIDKNKALQFSAIHSFNDLPQELTINPSVINFDLERDLQKSRFKKTYLGGDASLLGSKSRDKYSFSLGVTLESSPFTSNLINEQGSLSSNSFDFEKKIIYNKGLYEFNRKQWEVSPSYSFKILNQNLHQSIENTSETQENLVIEPELSIKYNLNEISFLRAVASLNQNTNAEQYFFLNQILINNRVTLVNEPSLDLQTKQVYSIFYYNNNLYKQSEFNVNFSYQQSTGNFFSSYSITPLTTQIQYFFLPVNNSIWSTDVFISKYIDTLESTFKLTSQYSLSNYRNVVNNSDLRQNQRQLFSTTFFWKTAFDVSINFENSLSLEYSNSKNENQPAFTNTAFQNISKVILKPSNNLFIIFSSDYYLPDLSQRDLNFTFLDATMRYRPKSKKWDISFLLRNLANQENFFQVETTDISTVIFRSTLLPMHFLLNYKFNF